MLHPPLQTTPRIGQSHLSHHPSTSRMRISTTASSTEDIKKLSSIFNCTSIRTADISGNFISDLLSGIRFIPKIQREDSQSTSLHCNQAENSTEEEKCCNGLMNGQPSSSSWVEQQQSIADCLSHSFRCLHLYEDGIPGHPHCCSHRSPSLHSTSSPTNIGEPNPKYIRDSQQTLLFW